MKTYLVPSDYGEVEFIEKRSRFIGRVWPVADEAEAISRIEQMRKKHYDATHNVYAYIIRENGIMRYSDDGEPSGTSGQPTLNVFRNEEIQNGCCVITRYFGGILLGAGGLVRAYSATAKLALDAAGITQMAQWKSLLLPCSYSQYERVRRLLDKYEAVIEATDFGADIVLEVLLRLDVSEKFSAELLDMSDGTVESMENGECFRGVKIK